MTKGLHFEFDLPFVNLNSQWSTTLDSAVLDASHFPQGCLTLGCLRLRRKRTEDNLRNQNQLVQGRRTMCSICGEEARVQTCTPEDSGDSEKSVPRPSMMTSSAFFWNTCTLDSTFCIEFNLQMSLMT